MLGGLDPIIIFQFSKLSGTAYADKLAKIPVVSEVTTLIDQPPIPIYLSQSLTGIYIDSEDKNVDIQTDVETLSSGEAPTVDQKGAGSTVAINLVAKKDSIGLALLSAMIDLIFDKVTSKEYAITYMHGATTIFRGVLHSYQANQNASNELLSIKIELSRGEKTPQKPASTPQVPALRGAVPIG